MKKPKISLYIPEEKKEILKDFANNRNISMNSLIIEALDKIYGPELFFTQIHHDKNPKHCTHKIKETNKNK